MRNPQAARQQAGQQQPAAASPLRATSHAWLALLILTAAAFSHCRTAAALAHAAAQIAVRHSRRCVRAVLPRALARPRQLAWLPQWRCCCAVSRSSPSLVCELPPSLFF